MFPIRRLKNHLLRSVSVSMFMYWPQIWLSSWKPWRVGDGVNARFQDRSWIRCTCYNHIIHIGNLFMHSFWLQGLHFCKERKTENRLCLGRNLCMKVYTFHCYFRGNSLRMNSITPNMLRARGWLLKHKLTPKLCFLRRASSVNQQDLIQYQPRDINALIFEFIRTYRTCKTFSFWTPMQNFLFHEKLRKITVN